eukprot:m.73231 g.73231  ORF g.73231 m.73231 type:complete len:508 (-) comp14328_c0_seq1:16-1539(-)
MSEARPLLINAGGGMSTASVSFVRPLVFSLIAALGPLAFGYSLGFTSPLQTVLEKEPAGDGFLTKSQNTFFGSQINIGAMIGAFLGGPILEILGRRRGIALACLPFAGGYLAIFWAKSVAVLYLGRILTGVGVGLVSLGVPVYIAEISPSEYRGGLGTINQLAVTVGVLLVYAIGLALDASKSTSHWHPLALIAAIIAGALFVLTFFIPATPRWLLSKGRRSEAERAVRSIQGPLADCENELRSIEQAIEESQKIGKASLSELFQGAAAKAMVIAFGLMLVQQFSGINVVIFFSGKIFSQAGFTNANLPALVVSIVQVIVTGISCLIIDKAGRRALLLMATIGMTASCIVLGYYFYLLDHNQDPEGVIALVSVVLYIACFSLGLGAIPWLIMSEVFPMRVRGVAASLATLFNWTCSFIVTETFQSTIDAFTEAGTFWFYAAVCAGGALFVMAYVPETKGRTLEEIERYLGGDRSVMGNSQSSGQDLVKVSALLAMGFIGIVVLVNST